MRKHFSHPPTTHQIDNSTTLPLCQVMHRSALQTLVNQPLLHYRQAIASTTIHLLAPQEKACWLQPAPFTGRPRLTAQQRNSKSKNKRRRSDVSKSPGSFISTTLS